MSDYYYTHDLNKCLRIVRLGKHKSNNPLIAKAWKGKPKATLYKEYDTLTAEQQQTVLNHIKKYVGVL